MEEEAEDTIIRLFHKVLDERDSIDHETHKEDHLFVAMLREERKARYDRWEAVKTSTLGWLVIVVIGGTFVTVGTAIWHYAMYLIKNGNNPTP